MVQGNQDVYINMNLPPAEDILAAFFESSAEGYFLANKSGHLIKVNQPFCDYLGYSRSEIHLVSLNQLFPHLDLIREKGIPNIPITESLKTIAKNGSELFLKIHLSAFSDGCLLGKIVLDSLDQQKINSLLADEACVKNAPISIFRLDQDGKINEVNDEACLSLGYTREELTRLNVFDISPIPTPEIWTAHRKELIKHKHRFLEGAHRRKDGSTFPVEITVNYLHFQGKDISFSFVQDVSKRKNAEDQANQIQLRFRILAEASFEGIAFSKDGLFIDINDQYVEMFGYERHEILNTPVLNVVAPQDRQMVAEYIKNRRFEPYVHQAVHKNGTNFMVEIRARSAWINNQEIRIAAVRDITEQKRKENDLHKLTLQGNAAFEIAKMALWEYDIASDIFLFNDQYYALLGTTAQLEGGYEMRGTNFAYKYISPDEIHRLQEAVHSAIQSKDPDFLFQTEGHFLKADGTELDMTTWFRVEKNEKGETVKLYGLNQDITERKRAEEEIYRLNSELEQRVRERTAQLIAANKELESFSYSISHDLRAPLRALNGFSKLLKEEYSSSLDNNAGIYLQRISAASTRMSLLIDDLLKLSRITRSDMQIKEINLSDMVIAIADELKSSQPERKSEWVIQQGLIDQGDKALVQIVLNNLLANAWKFSSKTARTFIEFGLKEENGEKIYFIRDNGAGFDMTYVDKLFREFQRLHSDQEFEGSGIGLALVQRIIHRHGGHVWAEGETDHGATFYFTLQGNIPC